MKLYDDAFDVEVENTGEQDAFAMVSFYSSGQTDRLALIRRILYERPIQPGESRWLQVPFKVEEVGHILRICLNYDSKLEFIVDPTAKLNVVSVFFSVYLRFPDEMAERQVKIVDSFTGSDAFNLRDCPAWPLADNKMPAQRL